MQKTLAVTHMHVFKYYIDFSKTLGLQSYGTKLTSPWLSHLSMYQEKIDRLPVEDGC